MPTNPNEHKSLQIIADPHLPMPGDAFLSLSARSCLAVRAGAVACSACAEACPAAVLKVDADGPRLAGDCLHCGRCSAACPSGALQSDGFLDVMPAPGRGLIEVECAKASCSASARAMRVPCLGGVTPSLLLQWWLAAGDRPLTMINRGWCQGCGAGGDEFAAEASLRQVREWLRACGVSESSAPAARLVPTRTDDMPPAIPVPAKPPPALSRRGFFRRVSTEVSQPAAQAAAPSGPRARLLRDPCALPARQRMLDTLQQLADRQGCSLPVGALPAVSVSDRCADHGICTGICPTAALTRVEQDDSFALRFDATRCVSCRRCEQACPEQALSLGTGGSSATVTLRSKATSTCIECGSAFAADRSRTVCPRCDGRAGLARSLFGMGSAEKQVKRNSTS